MKKKNMSKVALITGITGQDGSYLAEFLLRKNYIVHGLKRRSSSLNTSRIDHIYEDLFKKNKKFYMHYADLTDVLSMENIIQKFLPDEIYNLGAQSHVRVSFEIPEYTSNVNALGALRILEIIKRLKNKKKIKFYQASTSELFGGSKEKPQNENTRFYPKSPYACSKLFAHWITINYKESYDIFACNGILFNHESPRRGETFVTKKITNGLAKIFLGIQNDLKIGNLYAIRDWGHAEDYAKMQWKMLQQKKPSDFVIATGEQYSVKKFIEFTAKKLGISLTWTGKGLNEVGKIKKSIINKKLKIGKKIIRVNKKYFRPSEVNNLLGNYQKAKNLLKWKPTRDIHSLIEEMLDEELKLLNKTKIPK